MTIQVRSLYRIEAPHFVAGFETATRGDVERVIDAAPILKWAIGKTAGDAIGYCVRKGWKVNGK